MAVSPSETNLEKLAGELAANGLTVLRNFLLREATTFRLGGPAPLLVDCAKPDAVADACAILRQHDAPFMLIGGGSNLLVADDGPGCIVVRFTAPNARPQLHGDNVRVSAGANFDQLALFCCRHGFDRLVNGSGIPGTVGGAIVGNAGAFGWQIADDLVAIEILEPSGDRGWRPVTDFQFSYRESNLKNSGRIVLSAELSLPQADSAPLIAERQRILSLRAKKHPDLTVDSCAGSFFRNVEPTSKADRRQAAGWFLEQAGAKSMRVGGAGVFPRHANIPIRIGPDCRAADVAQLTENMAAAVQEKFELKLVREVQLIGNFPEPSS